HNRDQPRQVDLDQPGEAAQIGPMREHGLRAATGGIAMGSPRWPATPLVRVTVPLLLLALVAALAAPAAAARPAQVIVLPGATSAEGIAARRGATFYAVRLFAGDIFRGNLQRGTAELFIDAPAGRM